MFPNILPSVVTKYVKKEVELRHELMHEHRVTRKHKNRFGAMATFSSSGARRASLHPGREPAFAAAREQLHHMYREKRARGERVTGPWLRISMNRSASCASTTAATWPTASRLTKGGFATTLQNYESGYEASYETNARNKNYQAITMLVI